MLVCLLLIAWFFLLVAQPVASDKKDNGSDLKSLVRAIITHHSFNMQYAEASQEKYLDQLKFFHRCVWVEII
jgi:hypothetical protein